MNKGLRVRRSAGISLPELVLIAALCAVALALAVPAMQAARLSGNERAAQRSLLSIAEAQMSWKGEAIVDQDADLIGEYGLLGELSGELVPRDGAQAKAVSPAYIPELFATGGPDGPGCRALNGYVYRVFLVASVTAAGTALPGDDRSLGGPKETLSDANAIDEQENHFVIYAWPVSAGGTGRRAYVVTEARKVLATDMEQRRYSGLERMDGRNTPSPAAAFTSDDFTGALAVDATGADGNRWYIVATPQR